MDKKCVKLNLYEISMIITLLEKEICVDKQRQHDCRIAGDFIGADSIELKIENMRHSIKHLMEVSQEE